MAATIVRLNPFALHFVTMRCTCFHRVHFPCVFGWVSMHMKDGFWLQSLGVSESFSQGAVMCGSWPSLHAATYVGRNPFTIDEQWGCVIRSVVSLYVRDAHQTNAGGMPNGACGAGLKFPVCRGLLFPYLGQSKCIALFMHSGSPVSGVASFKCASNCMTVLHRRVDDMLRLPCAGFGFCG